MNEVNEHLFGLKTILHKAQAYCVYQERCSNEVMQKLRRWKVDDSRIPKIIDALIAENFFNDQRYTENFVGSKLRLNKWGRKKIVYELQLKKIPEIIISQAITSIDENEYQSAIQFLIVQKTKEVKEKDLFKKKNKIARFLISRGFEAEFVFKNMKIVEK
ncbi:MAG: regulatory protein RecX [Bacteroidota bacterium]